jgi:hypothetical protein
VAPPLGDQPAGGTTCLRSSRRRSPRTREDKGDERRARICVSLPLYPSSSMMCVRRSVGRQRRQWYLVSTAIVLQYDVFSLISFSKCESR